MPKPTKAEQVRAAIQRSVEEESSGNGAEHPVRIFNRDDALGIPVQIPVDLIKPNPDQPRTVIDEQADKELAESIRKHGILQPPMARTALAPQKGLDISRPT